MLPLFVVNLLGACALMSASWAVADEAADAASASDSSVTSAVTDSEPDPSVVALESMRANDSLMQDSLMDLVISMLGVIGLIVAVVWVLRKMPGMHRGTGRSLRFIDGLNVSQRERVVIVEVDGERVLLGVAPGSVRFLKDLPPSSETTDEASEASAQPRGRFGRFQQQLAKAKQHGMSASASERASGSNSPPKASP